MSPKRAAGVGVDVECWVVVGIPLIENQKVAKLPRVPEVLGLVQGWESECLGSEWIPLFEDNKVEQFPSSEFTKSDSFKVV